MDPRFRQSFAEALAKALRENEEKFEQQQQASGRRSTEVDGDDNDDLVVRTTFEQLHFDQPTGLSSRGCQLLAQALIRGDRPQYSLSNRLVSGLDQALDRYRARNGIGGVPGEALARPSDREREAGGATTAQLQGEMETNSPPTAGDGSDADGSLLRTQTTDTKESLAASLAQLAWTVHGRIPLRILCYNAPADALLGSYREEVPTRQAVDPSQLPDMSMVPQKPETAEPTVDEDPDLHRQHESDAIGDDDSSSTLSGLDRSSARPPLEGNDDDHEVWAAESDPSDYDYGENDAASLSADSSHDLEPSQWFNPPIETRMPLDVAHAIASLVSKLSFRNFADLPWSSSVDEELTQLALVLLLPRKHRHGSDILQCFDEVAWQRIALHAVHVMRDAAACHPSTRLPPYLQLLQSMIQVHGIESAAKSSVTSTQPSAPSLPPATWLSLSLLSSLCSTTCSDVRDRRKPNSASQERNVVQLIHFCVVHCMDSLVDVFDVLFHPSHGAFSDQSDNYRNDDASDDMLPSLFVPMFRVLAIPLPSPSKQVQSFQLLLNSGFFRQLLLLWQDRYDSLETSIASSDESTVLKDEVNYLECALLELCLASPNLLGKYAWRYPSFSAAVTKTEPATGSCVSLEWNLLGMQLSSASSGGLVQWKASSTLSTSLAKSAPSMKECRAAARHLFQCRFQLLGVMVEQWKAQRGNQVKACNDPVGAEQHVHDRQVLADFDAMLSRFVLWPTLVEALLSLEKPDDVEGNCWKAHESLLPLQRLLATFPKQASSVGDRPKSKLDDAIDLLDQEHSVSSNARGGSERSSYDPPTWKLGAQDAAVESLRRSLKTLQSLLEAAAGSSGDGRSLQFSSKAD